MKPFVKKLIAIGVVILVFLLGFAIDAVIATTYHLEVVSAVRQEDTPLLDEDGNAVPPDVGVADGKTHVLFTIRLTHYGKPVKGHVLYVKTNRNILVRAATDENGELLVDYTCYKARLRDPATPIILTATDENNSVFITVPAKTEYTLQMRKPAAEDDGGMKTDEIFYPLTAEQGGENA